MQISPHMPAHAHLQRLARTPTSRLRRITWVCCPTRTHPSPAKHIIPERGLLLSSAALLLPTLRGRRGLGSKSAHARDAYRKTQLLVTYRRIFLHVTSNCDGARPAAIQRGLRLPDSCCYSEARLAGVDRGLVLLRCYFCFVLTSPLVSSRFDSSPAAHSLTRTLPRPTPTNHPPHHAHHTPAATQQPRGCPGDPRGASASLPGTTGAPHGGQRPS